MDDAVLRTGWRTTPHHDRFAPDHPTYAASMAAHHAAIERGDDGYLDPSTGLFVMTSLALAARPCCDRGCRHCPWEPEP